MNIQLLPEGSMHQHVFAEVVRRSRSRDSSPKTYHTLIMDKKLHRSQILTMTVQSSLIRLRLKMWVAQFIKKHIPVFIPRRLISFSLPLSMSHQFSQLLKRRDPMWLVRDGETADRASKNWGIITPVNEMVRQDLCEAVGQAGATESMATLQTTSNELRELV